MARKALAVRRSRSEWARLVEEQRKSGLDEREYCRREGLNVATLRWWRSQRGRVPARRGIRAGAAPVFVPVTLRGPSAPTIDPGAVEILLQGDERRVRIRGDCPLELAVAITQALRGGESCS